MTYYWSGSCDLCILGNTTPPPQPFNGPFPGPTQVSQCQKRTSGLHGARGD